MVILIGGTSCSGKTKLANSLMRSLGIPYISVDHLMMGICRSNEDCGFTPMSDVSTINRYIWPMVREMIKTNIENDHSIIFEGFQILPHNITDLPEEYISQVFPFFLTLSSDYIKENYKSINRYRSVIESRSDVDDMTAMAKRNTELIDACKANSVECYSIKDDYEAEIQRITQEVLVAFHRNPPRQASRFVD